MFGVVVEIEATPCRCWEIALPDRVASGVTPDCVDARYVGTVCLALTFGETV
jgi:hypothetical protein